MVESPEMMEHEEADEEPEVDTNSTWKLYSLLPCTSQLELKDPQRANLLYDRALRENAGSYKLWHAYILHRLRQLSLIKHTATDEDYEDVNNLFERALVFMHRMPRIWIEYCTHLVSQLLITRTRRTFNRALEALPITQHFRIWPLYLNFIKSNHVPVETALVVYRRFLQLEPESAEDYIDFLLEKNRIDEAATLLCDIINRPLFQSKRDKSKFQLWEELCGIICEFSDKIHTIDAEAILRDAINLYPEQQGHLWNSLSQYYIRLGMFASARNIFDEAIHKVTSKKDFVEVWEAYTNFEEKLLEHLMEQDNLDRETLLEIELRQAALEDLITNNGLLLNQVALRQNPHNVREWQKRIELHEDLELKEETFQEAIRVIDPKQTIGKYEDLWINYALFQADIGNCRKAKDTFEKAIRAEYNKPDDLAKVWCAYIELQLIIQPATALNLAKQAVSNSRSLKLWSLYVDLEENFGTTKSTKAAYERILDIKIASPQLVLNYAQFLEDNQYYEDSFRVFERGVSLFKWPYSSCIWTTYLEKFVARYGNKKLDRTRDLIDQCIKDCPGKNSFEFYLLSAKLEEEHGLLSRARSIYTEAMDRIHDERKDDLYNIYIKSFAKLQPTKLEEA